MDEDSLESIGDRNQEIDRELKKYTIELNSTDPKENFCEMGNLEEILKEQRIIGLGEATHGTREFFRLKNRILRFLVEELGFRLLALEANFTEMLEIDKYIRNHDGDPMPFSRQWIWKTKEMLSIIEWLKDFNETRVPEDQVRFYGFDIQTARRSASFLVDYLERVDPEYVNTVREHLDLLAKQGLQLYKAGIEEAKLAPARRIVSDLRATMESRRSDYLSKSSEPLWEFASQHLTVLEQATTFGEEVQGCDGLFNENALCFREKAMANNIEWVLDHEQTESIAIWAHNEHVNKIKTTSGGYNVESMGNHLANTFGDEYYAIAFEFGKGDFLARGKSDTEGGEYKKRKCTLSNSLANTISTRFDSIGHSPLFLDFRGIKDDSVVGHWLNQDHQLHSIGTIYDPDKPERNVETYMLTDSFDGICYVDETRPTKLLQRKGNRLR